jgi:uncharacterized membrane protein
MTKGRLEAFSDGVIAIILTIMVLELKVPHGTGLATLRPLFPVIISYILSFINIGIYWNNHHHLMHVVTHVNGKVLWSNLHLLFWLSLVPFSTGWMGENHFESLPVAVYAFTLMMSGVAYYILVRALTGVSGQNDKLTEAIGDDRKGKISVLIYLAATLLAFVNSWVGFGLIIVVAGMWLIPDKRIEKKIAEEDQE